MRPRASSLLAVLPLVAAGCTAGQPYPPSGGAATSAAGAPPRRVALLLPLSGSNAGLGQAMLRAARVALAVPGSPVLDARDTGGTPEGAAEAVRLALAAGDTLVLGPLTNAETAAVAPVAGPAGVAVLAFTSDPAQARPGVWVLGITPDQQVSRLVDAARADGRSRFAAVLPQGAFGAALATALARDTADASAPTDIRRVAGFAATTAALKQVSGYDQRHAAVQAALKTAREQADAARSQAAAADGTPSPDLPPGSPAAGSQTAGSQTAGAQAEAPQVGAPQPGEPPAGSPDPDVATQPMAPPPIDALLLGITGAGLRDVAALLPFYDLKPPAVRVLGPALWARDAAHLGALNGAWYAAPDPALRAGFVRAYQAAPVPTAGASATPPMAAPGSGTGGPPPALADLAYDAAAVARVLAPQGYGPVALQRPEGFAGTDGVFSLQPDGTVRRELAVFEVEPGGGSHLVSGPAPGTRPPGT